MKKRAIRICAAAAALFAFAVLFAFADESNSVTIKGDGVTREMTYTMEDLQKLTEGVYSAAYSSENNWPNEKISYAKGVTLEYLLQQAGVKSDASLIRVTSSDGYYKTFTYDQLTADDKYSFTAGGTQKVKTILAYQRSSESMGTLQSCNPVLTMGQHTKGEQTYPWFVQDVAEIEVMTEEPETWSAVTFTKKITANGVEVTPVHEALNSVKIYYTTDGSAPSQSSNLYNVSATYYQPDLNKPILVTKNTEIKAIAVGPGKTDSPAASVSVVFSDDSFLDLDGYEWAQSAIEELAAKKVINGMGNGRFAPEGQLTRAQFAKMVVLALGYEPAVGYQARFSDIKAGEWYTPYVLKAAELGLIDGYTDGTFRPSQTLKKEEMVKIAACAAAKAGEIDRADLSVLDSSSATSSWAKKYVAFAEEKGILEHGHVALIKNGKLVFAGTNTANRAEAASVIAQMQKAI